MNQKRNDPFPGGAPFAEPARFEPMAESRRVGDRRSGDTRSTRRDFLRTVSLAGAAAGLGGVGALAQPATAPQRQPTITDLAEEMGGFVVASQLYKIQTEQGLEFFRLSAVWRCR